jgi:glycosyltransferase involved in cell wall biosynthesis
MTDIVPELAESSVLQVVQPPDGGVAEQFRRLCRGLPDLGWHVEVAAPPGSTLNALADDGIQVHELPMNRAPGPGDLRAAARLRAVDRRGGFDLVHAHSSKAGGLARLALARGERIVYTPHCFAFLGGPRPARGVYRAIEQALVPRTGALIAVSRWEAEQAAQALRGVRRRLRLVVNGVPACEEAAPHPELRRFAGDLPLAGMVSVLRPQKDPLNLVAAAASLVPSAGRVAIVGDGELARPVRDEIARRNVGGVVRWFPFEGSVWPYLRALDLFVLPSAWESLPFGVLEAMRCGLPVLATDVGGVSEAVENGRTGTLVPARDHAALANALRASLADAEGRREQGRRGRDQAETLFKSGAMVRATARVYHDCLDRYEQSGDP